jgi:outer membrane biosynthesis protein TonB
MTAPSLPFDVKAISAYSARNGNELSLEVGKIYRVLATDGRNVWWQSRTDDGLVGWFPANYTQIIETEPVPTPVIQPPPQPQPQPQVQAQAQAQPQPQSSSSSQQTAATVAAAAQPQVQASQPQVQAAQPQVQASQPQVTSSNNGSHVGSVPSERGQALRMNVDPVLKPGAPPLKDPCTLTVHLVESVHNTLPNGKSPTFFIYKRNVFNQDPKKLKPLFSITAKTKSGPWKWNEEFKLFIKDAETEVVCIRYCIKNDFKSKGKDILGETDFPLRGAVRKFDRPNGLFQWFPLKNGTEKVGESLLFIEYWDPRPFSGPSDVQHKGHVGLKDGGFEIRDIPQEWKQLFRVLNIKKKDLENNAEMAAEVFDLMKKAQDEGLLGGTNTDQAQSNHHQEANHHVSTPATTPVSPVAVSNHHQPQTTTPSTASAPAPPPPPAQSTGPKPPPVPEQVTGPKPPPPPGPSTGAGRSAGGMSLLEQIQKGTTLKTAQVKEVQAGNTSTGNPLADTLLVAMKKYRVDIVGKDTDDADDWD